MLGAFFLLLCILGLEPTVLSLLRCPTSQCYRISLVDRGASFCSLLRPQDALATSPVTRTMLNVHNGQVRYEHFFILSKV